MTGRTEVVLMPTRIRPIATMLLSAGAGLLAGCGATAPPPVAAALPAAPMQAEPDDDPPPAPEPSGPPSCRRLDEAHSEVVNGIQATISLYACADTDPPDLLINVRVWNVGAQPANLFVMPARYPMLVFDVRDAAGEALPNGPPPVPPEGPRDDWWVELSPDEDYLFDATLGSVVATGFAPGTYEIRFAYENASPERGGWIGRLETGWVRFTWRGRNP
jgi:hypothetical protein